MNRDTVIVIAEDDEGHFVLAKYFLQGIGIRNELIWHRDGEETVDFFERQKKDKDKNGLEKKFLLLLDINMPRMNGLEVLAIMKGDECLKKIPVIMVTTSTNPDNIKYCEELGCFGYLEKPLDDRFRDLVAKLE